MFFVLFLFVVVVVVFSITLVLFVCLFLLLLLLFVFCVYYPLAFNCRMNSVFFSRDNLERDWIGRRSLVVIVYRTKLHIRPGLVFVLRSRGNRYVKWRIICVFIESGLDVFTIERSIIMTKFFLLL